MFGERTRPRVRAVAPRHRELFAPQNYCGGGAAMSARGRVRSPD